MSKIADINKENIPEHIAIIMDGNGRWAKKEGSIRTIGHESGVKSVREVVEGGVELGVEYLTLYAFSTENWNRPKEEVETLMNILVNSILNERETLMKQGIRLNAIGQLDQLPSDCITTLNQVIEETSSNSNMTLTLALSYSGRWDLTTAMQKIGKEIKDGKINPEDVTADLITSHLSTNGIPDPALMIRTSGEMRISNFLLWQLAYSELYITEVLWPDFTKENLADAIINYQSRERRFGKTSEQIKA
jgi:undecaprenyl diphosphate synthase